MKVAFINPLRTNRPCVYLGSTTGIVHIIVPEGKGGFVYANVHFPIFIQIFLSFFFNHH